MECAFGHRRLSGARARRSGSGLARQYSGGAGNGDLCARRRLSQTAAGQHRRSGPARRYLAEIDTPELDQQFYQAKARWRRPISALEQARAALQHSETQLDYNRVNLDRWRTMKGRDLVAQQELDDRQVLVKSGQADVDAGHANVAAAEANVTANKANVERISESAVIPKYARAIRRRHHRAQRR